MTFLAAFTELLPYVAAMLVGTVVGTVLLRGHRAVPGRGHFGALMVCVALWAFFNLLEDGTNTLAAKVAYANVEFLFIGAVPVLFFGFAVRATYDPVPGWLASPWLTLSLWVVPVVCEALCWAPALSGAVFDHVRLVNVGAFTILQKDHGWFFWVFTAQSYVLIAAAMVLWGRFLWRRRTTVGTAVLLPYLAVFVPWIGNGLFLAGINPWPGHDPTTPLFSIMGLILMTLLGENQFLTRLPGVSEAVLEGWRDPLLVLDAQDKLVYFNPEAGRRWSLGRRDWGRSRAELFPWLGAAPTEAGPSSGLREEPEAHTNWQVDQRSLNYRGQVKGHLVTLHDVTSFERRVAERTEALESAYSRLTDELEHRRRTEQQLFYFSLHDPLTGLANRSQFLSRVSQALERQKRDADHGSALLALDVAGFHITNQTLGYDAGDLILVQLAQRLRAALRNVDTAARASGGAFLVLLDGVGTMLGVAEAALRIRRALEGPMDLRETSYLPQLRVGMLVLSSDYRRPEAAVDDVEAAARKAADNPAEPNQLFRPEWRLEQLDRIGLLDDLGKALIQGGLQLHYQPIVRLGDGVMAGVEVLSRWTHPTRGAVPPSRFIPLAEEEGTIKPLGLWVLRESARFFSRLERERPETRDLFLSVNVSPRQLAEREFASILMGILDRELLDPRRLHLELTETALVENTDRVVPVLRALRAEGMSVKLDDFGTGYSSLHSLHRLPVDTLKIDQSFVVELPQGRPIVKTIASLARELGLTIVAEGVETPDQHKILAELGCQEGQGFLYSAGWSAADLEKRLALGVNKPLVDGLVRRA